MDDYDACPYESIAFPETHPHHLAVLGRLEARQSQQVVEHHHPT